MHFADLGSCVPESRDVCAGWEVDKVDGVELFALFTILFNDYAK